MRYLAIIALGEVFQRGRKPKGVLETLSSTVDKRDRAFLKELLYGVIRYRDYLDWLLKDFLRKPSGVSAHTLNNLRSAVYQIQFMRVPEWAIVNEAVGLEKSGEGKPSLVNAVLRNFLRHRTDIGDPPQSDPLEYTATTTSHPRWLVRRWIKRFGADEALRLARANNEIPRLTLRIDEAMERKEVVAMLAEKGLRAHPTAYSPVGIALEDLSSFSELSDALAVKYVVQDEAAQLVTYLLDPAPGERILDACAAPGGKTTHLAHLMKDRGEIVAVESEKERIEQMKDNIARLGLRSIRIVHRDIRDVQDTGFYDRALLDAPCSSLGVIRRNPDVKYRYEEKELLRFKDRQLAMLGALSPLLKPGGDLVYSVCSTEPEEGEEVVGEFLQAHPNFSIIEGAGEILKPFEVVHSSRHLFYRTFPHRHSMDGFFFARLKKTR